LNKLKTTAGATPYNVRKNEESNDNDGPDPILETALMYPAVVDHFDALFSLDPSVKYPAIKDTLAAVRTYKINNKYPTQYTLETLLNHTSEYWALYLDTDGEAISSVLNANVYEVIREAVYYATPDEAPTAGGFVISDNNGVEIGYDSISKGLASLLVELGVSVQYGKKLVSIYNSSGSLNLNFADGSTVNSNHVVLNIPLAQVKELSHDSVLFNTESTKLFGMINTVCAVKAYFYYPVAWWKQYGDSSVSTTAINKYFEFKDSNIRCVNNQCDGVTQVVYADGLDYCTSFWTGSNDVLTIINSTDTDPIRSQLFSMLARSTNEVRKQALKSSEAISEPTVLVMGRWKAGWHTIRSSS